MRSTLISLAAVAVLTLSGCGDGDGSADQAPSSSTSSSVSSPSASSEESPTSSPSQQLVDKGTHEDITVQGDTVTPSAKRVDIDAGERLVLTVTADRAGELHVHSSPEQELAFDRGTTVLDLVLTSPGIVEVEEHESETVILRVYVS